jgi:hypothetical protein
MGDISRLFLSFPFHREAGVLYISGFLPIRLSHICTLVVLFETENAGVYFIQNRLPLQSIEKFNFQRQ